MLNSEKTKIILYVEGGVGFGQTMVEHKLSSNILVHQIIKELIKDFGLREELDYIIFLDKEGHKIRLDNSSTLNHSGIRDGQLLELKAYWKQETLNKVKIVSSKIMVENFATSTKNQRVVTVMNTMSGEKTLMSVPINEDIEILTLAMAEKLNLPLDFTYTLEKYNPHQKLYNPYPRRKPLSHTKQASISNGDLLGLEVVITAGGGIPLPSGSYQNFQIVTARLEHANKQSLSPYKIFSIFLYSEADKAISAFVREHFLELSFMAGRNLLFYVIEQPDEKWLPSIRTELQEKFGALSERILLKIEAEQLKPLTSEMMYSIANRFKIKKNDLPCIIFFTEIEGRNILHVPFEYLFDVPAAKADEGQILQMFRRLFDVVDTVLEKNSNNKLDELDKLITRKLRAKAKIKLLFGNSLSLTLDETIKTVIGGIIKLLLFGR